MNKFKVKIMGYADHKTSAPRVEQGRNVVAAEGCEDSG